MTNPCDRKDINRLFAKLYAELARDLTTQNDSKDSIIYALHHNEVNAYHSADAAEKPQRAHSVVDAFAAVLTDPTERKQFKTAFSSEEEARSFADGMRSIFREGAHKVLRPYDPYCETDSKGKLQVLGW